MTSYHRPIQTAASRRELVLVVALTAAGLVARLLLWSTQSMVSVDGTVYIRLAQALAGGPALDSVQPPGYPFLIWLFRLPLRDWILSARAVDLVAGVSLIPLTWVLARAYVSRPWLRLGTAAAVAAMPLTLHYSLTTMSEAPYLAVLLVAFILVSRKRWFGAGLVVGLAYLIRPEALAAAGMLVLIGLRRPRLAARLGVGVALVVIPFVLLQGVQTGTWSLTAKTINIGGDQWWENEPVAGVETAASAGERVQSFWRESLAAYPRRLGALSTQLLRHGGWVLPFLALPALGGPAGILGAGLAQLLVTPLFALGAHARFALPFLPFVWILAAAFLDRLRLRSAVVLGVVALSGLGAAAVIEAPTYHRNEDGVFPELLEAAAWLRPYVGPETVIYDRKPYVAFYAGGTQRSIPMGGYDTLLDTIVRDGGDYLVVDQAVVDFFRPQLLPLVMDKAVIWNEARLTPIYVNRTYQGRRTLVYRVVRPGGPRPMPGEKDLKREIGSIDHGSDHFFHGILAMRKERWKVAAGEFLYAIRRDSTNADALNNRAWCLLRADYTLVEAVKAARSAVNLKPENLDYLDTLVEVLKAVGRNEEAALYRARMDSLATSGSQGTGAPDDR